MSKLFKKITKKNTKELQLELAHAHLIVALLSIAIITLLAMGAREPIAFDATLSAICVALLSLVAIISLCVALTLYRKK